MLHILFAVLGLAVGIGAGAIIHRALTRRSLTNARSEAEEILQKAEQEALARAQTIELETEKKATEHRHRVDREVADSLGELKKTQERANKREETLDKRFEQIERRESKLETRDNESRARSERAETLEKEAEEA